MNIYYMIIKLKGDKVDNSTTTDPDEEEAEPFVKSTFHMNITSIDRTSNGVLEFSQPVNMQNAVNRFNDIFVVYVKNVAKEIDEIVSFDITSTKDDKLMYF